MAVGQLQTTQNTIVNAQGRADGSLFRADRHPRNMQSVFDGTVYTASNPMGTPVTTQAGLSATTPALTLYNPVGSGVNAVLIAANVSITSSPAAAAAFALAQNAVNATPPASTTAATVTNNLLGSTSTPACGAYRVATLAAAPVAVCYLGGVTGASAIGGVALTRNFDGEYIVPPGVAVSIQASSAAAILASISWKEIPITAV